MMHVTNANMEKQRLRACQSDIVVAVTAVTAVVCFDDCQVDRGLSARMFQTLSLSKFSKTVMGHCWSDRLV
jgi:hypothetical protein